MKLLLVLLAACYRAPSSIPRPPPPAIATPSPPPTTPPGWHRFELGGPLQSLAVRDHRVFALAVDDTLTVHTADGTLLHDTNLAIDKLPGPHNVALDAFSHRPFGLLPVSDRIAVVIGDDFAAGFDFKTGRHTWGYGGIHISADQQIVRGAMQVDGDFATIPERVPTTSAWLDLASGRFSRRPKRAWKPPHIDVNYNAFPSGGGIAIEGSIREPYQLIWQHKIRPPNVYPHDVRYYLPVGDLIALQPNETTLELVDRDTGATIMTLPLPTRQGLHRVTRDGDLIWIDLLDVASSAENHHLIALDGPRVITELTTREAPACRTQLSWRVDKGTTAVAHQIAGPTGCTTVVDTFTR